MSAEGTLKQMPSGDGTEVLNADIKSSLNPSFEHRRNTGESGTIEEDIKHTDCKEMEQEIEWTPENCTKLLYAMAGHKPAGVNKHFEMACIMEKFQYIMKRKVPVKAVWDQLSRWYNLDAVDAIEGITFPNDEVEFHLPEEFFTSASEETQESDLQKEKKVEVISKELIKKEKEESPNIKTPFPKVENVKGKKDKLEQSKQKGTPVTSNTFKSPKAKLTIEELKKRKRKDSSD